MDLIGIFTILRKYAPDLKGKEIEENLDKPNVITNRKANYKAFVQYLINKIFNKLKN